MDDLHLGPVDEVVLAWLVLPRKKPSTRGLGNAIKPLLGSSTEDAKKVASETLGQLKAQGLIERDTQLMLTKEGRQRALTVLGITDLPKRRKVDWNWAKKLLVLRAIGLPVTPATIEKSGTAAWLAKSVLISHHRLSLKDDAKAAEIFAALAWKAIGQDDGGTFALKHLFGPFLLRGTPPVAGAPPRSTDADHGSPAPAAPPVADGLPGFAAGVREAAQASPTGRWHGNKVFISHVWNEVQRRGGADGMTFEEFQERLIEANRAQLIELSRADLVQAMPREDVAASETRYLNASFHFVRLDDR